VHPGRRIESLVIVELDSEALIIILYDGRLGKYTNTVFPFIITGIGLDSARIFCRGKLLTDGLYVDSARKPDYESRQAMTSVSSCLNEIVI
jgi:hypothetical protein